MKKLIAKIKEKAILTKEETINEYTSKLESIILDFHSKGFDSRKIINNFYTNMDNHYIGQACELSAAHHFLKMFPVGFFYHGKSDLTKSQTIHNTKKNFDFSFENEGLRFNVEVKSFTAKLPNKDSIPIKFFLKKEDMHYLYEQGAKPTRNCMPALSRFLKDANDQLVRPKVGMSVIMVCCNDLDEYTDALECFASYPNGIFYRTESDNIVPSINDIGNIDSIVLCNLGFEHNGLFNPKVINDFYRSNDFKLDGCSVWNYKRSIPVLPIVIRINNKITEEKHLYILEKSFFSHTQLIDNAMKTENLDLQKSVFSVFNKILNRKL